MINAAVDYDTISLRDRGRPHAGLKLSARGALHPGRAWPRRGLALVTAASRGARIFDPSNADSDHPYRRVSGTRAFLAPVLAHRPAAELADALDDASFVRNRPGDRQAAPPLTGQAVGTPIIRSRPTSGIAFFRPRDQPACPVRPRPSRCGITCRGLPVPRLRLAQAAEPRCGRGRSCAASGGSGQGRRQEGLVRRQPRARDNACIRAVHVAARWSGFDGRLGLWWAISPRSGLPSAAATGPFRCACARPRSERVSKIPELGGR